MFSLCTLLFAAVVAQTVDGCPDLPQQWNGTDFCHYFGNSSDNADDVNSNRPAKHCWCENPARLNTRTTNLADYISAREGAVQLPPLD